MPTFKQEHMAHFGLAHYRQADAAGFCYLLVGTPVLIYELRDPKVHFTAAAAILLGGCLSVEDWQQRGGVV